MSMSALTIAPVGERVSQWGEGPIWWEGTLWYVDIEGHSVCCLDPQSGKEQSWNIGYRPGTVVPRAGRSGGLVLAGDYGIAFFDPQTGQLDPVPGLGDQHGERPGHRHLGMGPQKDPGGLDRGRGPAARSAPQGADEAHHGAQTFRDDQIHQIVDVRQLLAVERVGGDTATQIE